ncbi:hypothetical protein BOX15_Mlig029053g1 [Macrostomum lignano]|uniref:Hemicentin-1-like von Willebrand factor A domain-containing protein n=1 Tax=Macrostomum lignano TaxID=282301 RepID=A0A267DP25_9PLAT|nr:hypothetical protein BOX15_Mlig029053g2 [Macrostomum lignano]PAA53417.1 hypothetical protein BOX15_Mlig029053g1 [Macrostomum lignano]
MKPSFAIPLVLCAAISIGTVLAAECPSGYKKVCVKKFICSSKCHIVRRRGSLAFTIDDTGSMWREIRAVKTNIKRIVKANRRFKDYVIGTFNDPYRRKVIRSRSAYTILRFLKRVRARRGGDCPEFAMRGILDAARLARPRSVLFVVTDASAKDARLKYAVARYLRSKKIRLFAVKVGRMCGRRYRREFEFLARQTGGRVLRLRNRRHFKYVLNYIGHASKGETTFTSMPSSEKHLRKKWKPECICKIKTVVKCVTRCPDGYERVNDTCVKPR